MDTPESKKIEVLKQRSYARCLRDGLATGLKNTGSWIRLSWPVVLAFSVLYACFCTLLPNIPVLPASGHSWQTCGVVALIGIMMFLAEIGVYACTFWHQHKLIDLGYLPEVRLWNEWHSVAGVFIRVLRIALVGLGIWILYLCLSYAIFHGLGTMTTGPATAKWMWLLVGISLLMLLLLKLWLMGSCCIVIMEYVLGKTSLAMAFRSYAWGKRYLGRTIIVGLLSVLIALLLWALMSLPMFLCNHVDNIVGNMLLEGEVAVLPTYYPVFRFTVMIISALASCFSILLVLYPLCFNWGAMHAIESERKEAMVEG